MDWKIYVADPKSEALNFCQEEWGDGFGYGYGDDFGDGCGNGYSYGYDFDKGDDFGVEDGQNWEDE